jgi:uncharacterized protein YebE (UPF0316 family)
MPLFIFCARIIDVTVGTMRIIFVSRGLRLLAPLAAFFEVLVWLVALGQIFSDLGNPLYYIAYAAGFAAGNYIGIIVEEKLAVGTAMVRIITQYDASELLASLQEAGFSTTAVDAQGKHGPVKIIFIVLRRRNIPGVISMVTRFNPLSFYTVEDIRSVSAGGLYPYATRNRRRIFRRFRPGK